MLLKKQHMRRLLFRPPYFSPAIYCAAHHGNNLYLRRDAVSFQALGEVVNGRVILTKGLMPLPFTQHHQRQTRKLTSAFFFLDETQDGICQSLSQQISGLCQLALPPALRLLTNASSNGVDIDNTRTHMR